MYKLVIPEFVSWILDKLNECDEKTPWMGPVHNQSLQQHPGIKHKKSELSEHLNY
jgi:hypothetical protein